MECLLCKNYNSNVICHKYNYFGNKLRDMTLQTYALKELFEIKIDITVL